MFMQCVWYIHGVTKRTGTPCEEIRLKSSHLGGKRPYPLSTPPGYSTFFFFFLRQDLSLTWGSLIQLNWLACEIQVALPAWDYRCALLPLAFYMDARDPKSSCFSD